MAKAKRATRKDLEKIIGQLIQEVSHLKRAVNAIDHYTGAYVAWKGDTITFNQHIEEKIKEGEKRLKEDKTIQAPL